MHAFRENRNPNIKWTHIYNPYKRISQKGRMLMSSTELFLSLFHKQCRSRPDSCSWRCSLNWVHTICRYTYVNYLKYIFRCSNFAGFLRVKSCFVSKLKSRLVFSFYLVCLKKTCFNYAVMPLYSNKSFLTNMNIQWKLFTQTLLKTAKFFTTSVVFTRMYQFSSVQFITTEIQFNVNFFCIKHCRCKEGWF